jgi:hypothetical protein
LIGSLLSWSFDGQGITTQLSIGKASKLDFELKKEKNPQLKGPLCNNNIITIAPW